MNNLITIREASDLLGVSIKTLRRWEQQGKIAPIRTRGGHRRFRPEDLLQSGQANPLIIGYARVNRPEQKPQLDTQIKALEDFCHQFLTRTTPIPCFPSGEGFFEGFPIHPGHH